MRQTLTFSPHRLIEAGCWVVVVGPATVRAVALGNQIQSSISDSQGQVCKTIDEWPLGVLLHVELETLV